MWMLPSTCRLLVVQVFPDDWTHGKSLKIDEFFVSVGCLHPRTAVEAVRWILVLIIII